MKVPSAKHEKSVIHESLLSWKFRWFISQSDLWHPWKYLDDFILMIFILPEIGHFFSFQSSYDLSMPWKLHCWHCFVCTTTFSVHLWSYRVPNGQLASKLTILYLWPSFLSILIWSVNYSTDEVLLQGICQTPSPTRFFWNVNLTDSKKKNIEEKIQVGFFCAQTSSFFAFLTIFIYSIDCTVYKLLTLVTWHINMQGR